MTRYFQPDQLTNDVDSCRRMHEDVRKVVEKERLTPEAQPERAVQIALPMAEVLNSLEQGLGELVRKVGRMFIESVLEAEVEQIAGPRSRRNRRERDIAGVSSKAHGRSTGSDHRLGWVASALL